MSDWISYVILGMGALFISYLLFKAFKPFFLKPDVHFDADLLRTRIEEIRCPRIYDSQGLGVARAFSLAAHGTYGLFLKELGQLYSCCCPQDPAALRVIEKEAGGAKVTWNGHKFNLLFSIDMDGQISYQLLDYRGNTFTGENSSVEELIETLGAYCS